MFYMTQILPYGALERHCSCRQTSFLPPISTRCSLRKGSSSLLKNGASSSSVHFLQVFVSNEIS